MGLVLWPVHSKASLYSCLPLPAVREGDPSSHSRSMERHELSQGEKGQGDLSKKALVGVQGARQFEAKCVLKHLAGSGPEVQKKKISSKEKPLGRTKP